MQKIKYWILGILTALSFSVLTAYAISWSQPPTIQQGDLFVATSTTQAVRLPTSTRGSVLWMGPNRVPAWTATSTLGLQSTLTLPLSIANGGTNRTSFTNTGIVVASASALANSTAFTFNPVNGRFAINTTTPAAVISVEDGGDNIPYLILASSTNHSIIFQVGYNGSTTISSLTAGLVRSTSGGNIYTDTASYQPLLVSGTNIKTINGTTLLGSGDLTVSGSGNSAFLFGNGFIYNATSTDNVGIDNTSPSFPLDIGRSGKLNFTNGGWLLEGGNTFAFASSTNQDTILGLSAGGGNATTSATAASNSSFGYKAGATLTTGTHNTGIGAFALDTVTSESGNTAIGYLTMHGGTGGTDNTAIGSAAMDVGGGAVGSRNISIGSKGNSSYGTSGSGNIEIGSYVILPSTSASGQLNIGNVLYGSGLYNTASQSSTPNGGKIGINTTTPSAVLDVYGSGTSNPFNVSSSSNISLFQVAANGSTTISSLGAGPVYSTSGGSLYIGASASGITSLNGLSGASQTFASTTGGTQWTITSNGTVHTWNIPNSPSFAGITVTNASTTNLSIATNVYLTNTANCTNGLISGAAGLVACNGSAFVTGTGVNGYAARWTGSTSLSQAALIDDGTVTGIGATSSGVALTVKGISGSNNPIKVTSSTGTTLLQVGPNGSTTISSLIAGVVYSTAGGAVYNDVLPGGTNCIDDVGGIIGTTGSGDCATLGGNQTFSGLNTFNATTTLATTTITSLTVAGNSISGTNSGDVTLAGQNYLTISGQQITANAVNLSGSHVTGTLAVARLPAFVGDVTTSAGSATTTLATVNSNVGTFGDATHVLQATVNAKGLITAASNVSITGLLSGLTIGRIPYSSSATALSDAAVLLYNGTVAGFNATSSTIDFNITGTSASSNDLFVAASSTNTLGLKVLGNGSYYSMAISSTTISTITYTIDASGGNVQSYVLSTSTTLTINNIKAGLRGIFNMQQDSTGSRTITWPSSFHWPAGTAPTLTTTANKVDVITYECYSTLVCFAGSNLNYSP